MRKKKKISLDPFYQLFEHHLLNRSYDDSAVFSKEVAENYLNYLNSTPAHTPFHLRKDILKDLESEAHELLIKKMYGCLKITELENYGKVILRKQGEAAYVSYELPPPVSNPELKKP